MSKIIALLGLMGLQFFISYFIFTVGWGLTVASWPALITGLVGTIVVSVAMSVVNAE